jgi:hypothetical protein
MELSSIYTAENLIFFARSEINGGHEITVGVNYMLESGNAKVVRR